MAEIRALQIGLAVQLSTGAKVFCAQSEDGESLCYELTAPDDIVTRFALSHEALDAMLDVACELLKRATSSSGNAGVSASPAESISAKPPMVPPSAQQEKTE